MPLADATAAPVAAHVTSQDLLDGLKDPTRWLTYSGDYNGQRHSPLTQITPENVDKLTAQWTFQTGTLGSFQTTPIVIDGVVYATGYNNNAWAIDARIRPHDLAISPQAARRSEAVLRRGEPRLRACSAIASSWRRSTRILIALDMKTGDVLWDVELADYKLGYSATVAPLVVKDKVIVGVAGAEYGIRGFIDAYDAQTGKRAWRFYTVGRPGRSRRAHLAAATTPTCAAAARSG